MKNDILHNLSIILTKKEKRELILLSAGSFILSVSEVISIGILIPIIWIFVNPEKIHSSVFLRRLYEFCGARGDMAFVTFLSVCAVAVFLFKTCYAIFMLYWQQRYIGGVFNRLTASALEYYLTREYSFHLLSNSAVLFKNVSSEVSQFTSYFLLPVVMISSEAVVLAGIFVFMAVSYPAVTALLTVLAGGVTAAGQAVLKKKIRAYAQGRNVYSEQYYKFSLESLGAVKEIQVFDVHDFFVARFKGAIRKYTDSFVKFSVASALPRHILEMTVFSSIFIVILFSVHFFKNHSEIIPMMTVIGVVALRLLPSISKITVNLNAFHFSFNSVDTLREMAKNMSVSGGSGEHGGFAGAGLKISPVQSLPVANVLSLSNISFTYATADKSLFRDISLHIPLGRTAAFIGETGAGKSTLVDIIMGLLIPEKGEMRLGGRLIDRETMSSYRAMIGYVPQSIFLFDDSVISNIALGEQEPAIDKRGIEKALRISQLEEFIGELPVGLRTQVGEKGVRISGGQRQRIGIARALYRNPAILILDEATSALDLRTEQKVLEAIKAENKTLILVTHRLHTLMHADLIFLIADGRIVRQGTFEEMQPVIRGFTKDNAPSLV